MGDGTTVDHLQAYGGSDDGFEWFGGTVNVRYLVSTDNTDDSFDWTEGWSGKGQFMVAHQISAECDALMECDNNDNDEVAAPISHPVLANVTLVGNNSDENKRGIRLRAGTEVELYNAIVTGKPRALTTETAHTEEALADGTSVLKHVYLSNGVSSDSDNVLYTQDMFLAEANHNQVDYTFSLTDNFFGTIAGDLDASTIDSFFESASFAGAISADSNWMAGWTR